MAYINLGNVSSSGKIERGSTLFSICVQCWYEDELNEEEEDDDWSNTWIKEPQRRSLSISFICLRCVVLSEVITTVHWTRLKIRNSI